MEAIKSLKESKRTLKSAITKALNDLAVRLAVKEPDCAQISASLEHIEAKKEEALAIMRDLEIEYEKLKKTADAEKTSDEADALVDRVDNDTNTARSYLAAQAKIFSSKQKESSEIEGHTNAQQGASDPNKQLERIRIPIFSGNKMEFQQWFAAFSTCVDKTSLAPQFKMLRLEGCLRGEAAETIKGLGYSQTAYDAALSRLQRKYGGDRRKVQAQIEELRKMRPVNEGDPKSMDKFADALERTIVVLKDNSLHADLGGGTLYGIVVEKLPENLLKEYYHWVKEQGKNETMVTLNEWVAVEADLQTQASEVKHGFTRKYEDSKWSRRDGRNNKSYGASLQDGKKISNEIERKGKLCRACGETHHLEKCKVFTGWSFEKKWEAAKRFGVCFRCLDYDHLGHQCPKSKACDVAGCKKTHHPLLHESQPRQETKVPSTEGDTQTTTLNTIERHEERIIALRTVPAILKHGKRRLLVNCFLDEGSDTTYVNEDVIETLGISTEKEEITINVANDQKVRLMAATLEIGLESVDGKVDTTIVVKTSDKICGGMKPTDWVTMKQQWNHLKDIPFPHLAEKGVIDVLLGSDYYHLMFPMQEIRGQEDEPAARLCPLGWTAIGRIGKSTQPRGTACVNTGYLHTFRTCAQQLTPDIVTASDEDLNVTLKRFWDLETLGIVPQSQEENELTPLEKIAQKKVEQSLSYNGDRYEVSVPWKQDRPNLPNNRQMAERRLQLVEKKLQKDTQLANAYQGVIDDYLKKEYIRVVPTSEPRPESEWFLPHFPVVRPDRETTKVRIVFDASAQLNEKSLNTEALPGPKLQSNIFDILVRFRKELEVLVSDVSQMYHQLVLKPEDRPFHRFLWRNLDIQSPPQVYEFSRFVFGGCYCPFCAQFTWQRHAEIHKTQYPLAADAVRNHCYMDDLMPSVATIEIAKETRKQLTELGNLAGFHLRKWMSNQAEVLKDIPAEDRAQTIDLEENKLSTTKTLGVLWTADLDTFSFKYSLTPETELTKRKVLKKTATIFDPLGFLAPYVVRAKILIQQAWVEATGWDVPLPGHHQKQWKSWFEESIGLQGIRIPRCLKDRHSTAVKASLHTFSDASEAAYAAAVYIRHEYEDKSITTRLVGSKTRLSPLKAMSIPRLELMGAVIGLRLTKQISAALEIPLSPATFWVDSMNVVYWIHGQSRNYKPFVSHRVGEIHEQSDPNQWRYVPTKQNPADFGTRGLTVSELADSEMWWKGPTFLAFPESDWPKPKAANPKEEALTEVRAERRPDLKNQLSRQEEENDTQNSEQEHSTFVILEKETWRLNPARFSKWYRASSQGQLEIGYSLVRVRSWVMRFIKNCRVPEEQRIKGELTTKELSDTELDIIKEAQKEVFNEEIIALTARKELSKRSHLLPLTPMLAGGLLRSNTRLRRSDDLAADTKFPIILPKKHHVTQLIVKYHHEMESHEMGVNYTLNHLRARYHVIHSRQEVKACIHNCFECKRRFRLHPAKQQMAPLPQFRLQMTNRPFTNCATDYGGPYLTMQGRGRARTKRFLCLFVCLQTRCCHLEMATSLDTGSFMNAFTRMTARRGWPKIMVSDNGSNFVAADREIRELVAELDQEQIRRTTANKGVEWYWNPPAAPHFGGVFEALIKAAKRAISAILQDADVTDEELQTCFTGVESLLNSRPLTTISDDPNDEPVLTPNHHFRWAET